MLENSDFRVKEIKIKSIRYLLSRVIVQVLFLVLSEESP